MSDRITFYTNPMSRGQIARWALEEAGADYDQHLLAYGTDMKSDAYLAVNPMGKVPAIVHHGRVVTEAAAICAYLADAFPQAGLRPDGDGLADYHRWLFFAAGPVEAAVTARAIGWEASPDRMRMLGFGSFEQTIDTLERAVAGRRFIAGNHFTAADIYVGSQIDWGLMFKSIPSRPAFEEYIGPFRERPAYRKAKAIDMALIAEASKQG